MALRIWDPTLLVSTRHQVFDSFQALSPRNEVHWPVVVVDIDEQALRQVGQWPWPRSLVAQLIEKIGEGKPAAIGFDIVFAEPDRMSPERLATDLVGLDDTLLRLLGELPSNDAVLADAVARNRVVLGMGTSAERPDGESPNMPRITPAALIGGDPIRALHRYDGIVRNIEELDAAAAGRGVFILAPDVDGVVRRVPAAVAIGDSIVPALAVELLRVAAAETSFGLRVTGDRLSEVIVDRYAIPTDDAGRIWIRYAPIDARRRVSALDVLQARLEPDRFTDRFVLIGSSATALGDIRATPVSGYMSGTEIQAQLLETILSGVYLNRPRLAIGWELMSLIFVGLLLNIFVPRIRARWTIAFLVAVLALISASSWYVFQFHSALLDPSYPIVASGILFAAMTYAGRYAEERQKDEVRHAFGRYLSPIVVEQIAQHPERLELGGELRELSVMFADLRGFTTLSESLKHDPHALTTLVNRFMTPMTEAILANHGTVDKYIGDCVMSFWNAPVADTAHETHSCEAALAMLRALDDLNETLGREAAESLDTDAHQASLPPAGSSALHLNMGIGIATGPCVVGNMGSHHRFDYSVLGDTVNLASRLEGMTKVYGVSVIVSESVQKNVPSLALLELDRIAVKGKREAVGIYGLIGDRELAEGETYVQLSELHHLMLAAYRERAWDQSEEYLARCQSLMGRLEPLYKVYAGRIAEFRQQPPPPDWNGVFVSETK